MMPGSLMTRPHLRGSICHWAPQPSRPSLSGGDHYVTPSPCEDEGQNPEKKLGNSRSGCFGDSSLPGGGAGLSSAQETGENRTAVPEAVTMSMPLSEPSVS